jgi:uncharacterized protein (TIGR00304 family)
MEFLGELLSSVGFLVLLIGMALLIIGVLLIIIRSSSEDSEKKREAEHKEGKVRGGGVVIIGPIPIIFGTDRKVVLLAVAVAIVIMVIYILILISS